MTWVDTVYHIENGDILFKNTDIDDKGKSFFMRIVNEVTTGMSNARRRIKGLPKIKGRDHTEFLLWNGTILEAHSSVGGSGVRSMNFLKWMEREGYPKIEILRRPERMTPEQILVAHHEIIIDRGIPYALIPVIKEGFSSEVNEVSLNTNDLMNRGLFCSESSKKYAGYKPFTGMWPDELYDFLKNEGYESVYYGESSDLIK